VETLLALAKNAEHRLDDNDRAASYLHQILETDPVNREAYQALTRLLERGERWYDLIELYERRATAEGQRDPEAEIVCRLAIAELWGRRLNDDDSARDAIQKVLEIRPKHGGALLALAAVHERAEAWGEAAQALEQAAAVSQSAHDRAEVHFRRSRVLEAQGASDDQVEASLRSALEAEPSHVEALKAAEARARKQNDHTHLVQLLEARAAVAASPDRKPLLAEIATLYMGPLAAPDRAVTALTELSQQEPTDAQVKEDLASALVAAGRPAEAEKLLSELATALAKSKQNKVLARVQRQLGVIAETQGQSAAALQRFEGRLSAGSDPPRGGRLAGPPGHQAKRRREGPPLLPGAAAAELRREGRRDHQGRGLSRPRPPAPRRQGDPQGSQPVRTRPRVGSQEPGSEGRPGGIAKVAGGGGPHPYPLPLTRERVNMR
jgi:tetratricopeptide (TPR) repeat protein